ncbi:membrane-bound lytic murein transglycosylase MltF [Marinicella meishanensis]|uniref:membrane-bound lytic murein transglycosylase MltF n=1 Tax=Marinicella meishanensis TaxID=2873263 RepID=UPI001CBDA9B6|nr:membrane-bound lytic murein transglycosylase MltF [Marinicella sp. NBU2979]
MSNQSNPKANWWQWLLLPALVLMALMFTLSPWPTLNTWELIQQRGVLHYGTRTSLLSYFKDGDNDIGYEFRLLEAFAEQHGLQLEVHVFNNNGDLFAALSGGRIDVAGGHLSVTEERENRFVFTAPIGQTTTDLVTHYDHRQKNTLQAFEDLSGLVIANSSYSELLNRLPSFQPQRLETTQELTLFEIIRNINLKEVDYTLADSAIINIYQKFIPGIYQVLQVSAPLDTALMLRPHRSGQLQAQLNAFINQAQDSGLMAQLKEEILLYIPNIDSANTVTFFDKLQTVWPEIKELVYAVADAHDFDAALLAAISYQESHWDPDAVSFSGVKGLMMLTASTAQEVGVADRTDPKQSLEGGIKYLRNMQNKIPDRIEEPHRTLFALAAYNIGYAHLEDARILTQRAGLDPDDWFVVETFLAKLNNPSIAHELRYGNADGMTAVTYVNNIMTYKQLMNWKMNKEIRETRAPESIL